MKYYRIKKGKVIEVKPIANLKPAKFYKDKEGYFGVGRVCKKGLEVMAKIEEAKMQKEMEKYQDKVANNWIEKLENE